jgi:hypothetical protein
MGILKIRLVKRVGTLLLLRILAISIVLLSVKERTPTIRDNMESLMLNLHR